MCAYSHYCIMSFNFDLLGGMHMQNKLVQCKELNAKRIRSAQCKNLGYCTGHFNFEGTSSLDSKYLLKL